MARSFGLSSGSAVGTAGAASGGGSGLQIHDLWDGSIDNITAYLWHTVGTKPVPDNAIYLIWNGGTFSGEDNDGPAALSTWIDAKKWQTRLPDLVGTTANDGTGLPFVDWGSTDIGNGTPNFARRDMLIGRRADNVPLIMDDEYQRRVQ